MTGSKTHLLKSATQMDTQATKWWQFQVGFDSMCVKWCAQHRRCGENEVQFGFANWQIHPLTEGVPDPTLSLFPALKKVFLGS